MNRDETIALFERCEAARAEAKKAALAEGKSEDGTREIAHEAAKAVWNGWAAPLLAERKKLEEEERWSAEKNDFDILEGQNEETRKWLSDAAADFSRCHFQPPSSLRAERSNPAASTDAMDRHGAEAPRDDGTKDPRVKTILLEDSDANFSGFMFPSDARFDSATFTGPALFGSATFTGTAAFRSATFGGDAWFSSATFSGDALFGSATFSGDALFGSATFTGTASFGSATFTGPAWFYSATFSGDAWFRSATFSGDAWFYSATFSGDARFDGATFSGAAWFSSATFSGDARFYSATFSGDARFGSATFTCSARFSGAKFDRLANFAHSQFLGPADFNAIRGERAFSLAKATFEHVPDFIQAHFEEAPRLDNVDVVARMVVPYAVPAEEVTTPPPEGATRLKRLAAACKRIGRQGWRGCHPAWTYPRRWCIGAYARVFRADRDIPARWRALKRLAIQAHDQDREHEFFAGEIRSARFAGDWLLPLVRPKFTSRRLKWLNWLPVIFWRTSAWLGFFRFWFGIFYGLTSNYGRSVAQPALWWLGALAVAAMFNLGEHRGMAGNRAMAEFWGASWPSAYVTTSYEAWRWDRPCYVTQAQLGARREPSVEGSAQGGSDAPDLKQEVDALKREIARLKMRNGRPDIEVVGLSDKVRADTNVPFEALQLALRDGFLILYGDADTAHRIYGCLYGVELYGGGTPVAVVPAQVATASAIHKIFSAIMIFLFGLALRNMLKMK